MMPPVAHERNEALKARINPPSGRSLIPVACSTALGWAPRCLLPVELEQLKRMVHPATIADGENGCSSKQAPTPAGTSLIFETGTQRYLDLLFGCLRPRFPAPLRAMKKGPFRPQKKRSGYPPAAPPPSPPRRRDYNELCDFCDHHESNRQWCRRYTAES